MASLFDPITIGDISLSNRVVMAPLTRNRSPQAVPNDLNVAYYEQRASAGLLITEGTAISHQGQGYADVPGLYKPEAPAGWRKVTDLVHKAGGKIVVQMWHVGRISHDSLQPQGGKPVAPSAIRAKSKTYLVNPDGTGSFAETSEPRALEPAEIAGIVEDYRKASRAAIEAGSDGVEIHAANGYLIDQFLRSGSNERTDAYGGSIENRARFLFEVVDAVTKEIGAGRVGIRISPVTPPTTPSIRTRSRSSPMSSKASPDIRSPMCTSSKAPPAERVTTSRAIAPSTTQASVPPTQRPAAGRPG